jgi:hypothetical protein
MCGLVLSPSPTATVLMRTTAEPDTENKSLPHGLHATERTSSSGSVMTRVTSPMATSYTLTVQSVEPMARRRPSGLHATDLTPAVWTFVSIPQVGDRTGHKVHIRAHNRTPMHGRILSKRTHAHLTASATHFTVACCCHYSTSLPSKQRISSLSRIRRDSADAAWIHSQSAPPRDVASRMTG